MKKYGFTRLLAVTVLLNIATSLVHPVTPLFIKTRNLPDFMFGIMFAAMAFGSFVTGPLWGRLADRFGRLPVMMVSTVGYAAAQLTFGFMSDPVIIAILRLLSGMMVMGSTVALMASAVDLTDPANRAQKLSYYAAAMGIASPLGFLLGGLVGNISIQAAFTAQAVMLAAVCFCMPWLLGETLKPRMQPSCESDGTQDHVRAPKSKIVLPIILFYIGVVAAQFGAGGYDNAFNYYLTNDLGYMPSINGAVKGITGMLGLIANLTLNTLVVRKYNLDISLTSVLLLCAVSLAVVVLIPGGTLFFIVNGIFYMFSAMFVPLQQALSTERQAQGHGILSGVYNSSRSLGMMAGALSAGFTYTLNSKLPFVHQAVSFAVAAVVTYIGYALTSRRRPSK